MGIGVFNPLDSTVAGPDNLAVRVPCDEIIKRPYLPSSALPAFTGPARAQCFLRANSFSPQGLAPGLQPSSRRAQRGRATPPGHKGGRSGAGMEPAGPPELTFPTTVLTSLLP